MHRTACLAALAALSIACRDASAPTAPLRPYDLKPSSAVIVNRKVDAFVFVSLLCGTSREEFDTQGQLHILIAVGTDSNGGSHVKVHFNSAVLTGTNIRTGEEIQLRFANNTEAEGRLDGAQETTMTATSTAVIGEGPTAQHYLAHTTIHVTMNANGEPTAEVTEIHVECR